MKPLSVHIARIVNDHAYVAVNGLGTFISRRSPAHFEGDILHAPRTEVCFDMYTDGVADDILVKSVARAEGLSTDNAREEIDSAVASMRRRLELDGSVSIRNVGTLFQNGNRIEISSVSDSWLPDLELSPLAADEPAEPLPGEIAAKVERENFMRSLRRTASSAAAIAIFAFGAFIFSQLPAGNSSGAQMAGIGMDSRVSTAPSLATTEPVRYDTPVVLILNTPSDASCPVDDDVQNAAPQLSQEPGRYCFVVASLANRAEADKFIASNGPGLRILEKDGRFRVYSLTSDDYQALMNAVNATGQLERFPTGWVCRK